MLLHRAKSESRGPIASQASAMADGGDVKPDLKAEAITLKVKNASGEARFRERVGALRTGAASANATNRELVDQHAKKRMI